MSNAARRLSAHPAAIFIVPLLGSIVSSGGTLGLLAARLPRGTLILAGGTRRSPLDMP